PAPGQHGESRTRRELPHRPHVPWSLSRPSNLAAVLHYPGLRIVPSDRAARCSGTGRLAGILLLRRPIHTSCRVREDRAPSQPRQLRKTFNTTNTPRPCDRQHHTHPPPLRQKIRTCGGTPEERVTRRSSLSRMRCPEVKSRMANINGHPVQQRSRSRPSPSKRHSFLSPRACAKTRYEKFSRACEDSE